MKCEKCEGRGATFFMSSEDGPDVDICHHCGGTGMVDSGGITPQGHTIDVPCPDCDDKRKRMNDNSQATDTSSALFSAVYSVLVEKAGALECDRRDFIYHHSESEQPCEEWRFQGKLGFGGKYWRRDNRVSCYREDSTPERESIIAETNAALSSLNVEESRRDSGCDL